MITWMTRASFLDTAADLKDDELYAQIVDGMTLFQDMLYVNEFEKHPTSRMWYGYEVALGAYTSAMALEAISRGIFVNEHIQIAYDIAALRRSEEAVFERPTWMEDTDILRSHRSNIVRRFPDYKRVWKGTELNWPYLWPFSDGEGDYDIMLSKHDKALLQSGERQLPKSVRERVANL